MATERKGYSVEANGVRGWVFARTKASAHKKGKAMARRGLKTNGDGRYYLTDAISAHTEAFHADGSRASVYHSAAHDALRRENPQLGSRWTAARVRRLPNGRIHVEVTGRPIGARRGNPASFYEVLVGNIGAVYKGSSYKDALAKYNSYVRQSKSGAGRAGGEQVSLWKDNEPIREHDETEPGYTSNPRKRRR